MNKTEKIAYAQVVSFISQLPIDQYIKIPNDVLEYYKWNMDYTCNYRYDSSKNVDEQNMTKEAKEIIIALYREYFANTNEKSRVDSVLQKNEEILEQKKQEKYNPDKIFDLSKTKQERLPITIEDRKTFLGRMLSKIKKCFRKNEKKKM